MSLIYLVNVLIEWNRLFRTSSERLKNMLTFTWTDNIYQIDSIVDKIDQMDRHKARQDNARDKLFGELGHKNGGGSSRRS